ncbi:hypothetical protein AB0442_38440 [Kitasatospora sp. NPDC085895]|uniref:hypothetical protein n=1 Tax=Kitasatospora sp. NPDC085895 TaxID=3155057 RepID=UPI00345046AC
MDDEGPDGLLDPDDDTGHGFDPVAPWPEDNDDSGGGDRWSDPSQNTPDNPGHDGEDPEDDTDDDGWDDDLGPGRYPPPYTGLGLWDAHKEAELW